ncbi:MAG: DsbA family protein [Ottowia sp.]|uniref:DsbA family protein n=1 Tax=Ottowia sp. TaxID=1898956 RepID=UPI0039E39C3C
MKHIDFWLDFVSPYAYLAFEHLPRALEGLGYEVRLRPILFAALPQHHGQRAPVESAPERDGSHRHAVWQARQLGVPLQWPAAHPFDPLALLRLAHACARQGAPSRYVCETIFRHVWRGGGAADDAARLRALAKALAPAREPGSDEVKQALRAETDAAMAAGVSGVPTFGVDGCLCRGLDAWPTLRARLRGDEVPAPRA